MTIKTPKIDVRIIVSGADVAEFVSKSINQLDFEEDYNILITSIIPTNDIDIAKKVASGGDMILIGGFGRDESFNLLYNELKTDFNHVELFDYNNIVTEDETVDADLTRAEIFNSIIRAGLSYSLNIINIHMLENKLNEANRKYDKLLVEFEQLKEENNVLSRENLSQNDTINTLNNTIDNLKANFSSFKARYENIYNKDILEIYPLEELWLELFNERLGNDEKILIASEKFKPDNIIVGQGLIGAQSKELAMDWLKIIKTALIFIEENEDELSDFNKKPNSETSDISNAFENFWE